MKYTSTLASMLHNPNHPNFSDTCYRSERFQYKLKDNTLYNYQSVWCNDFRNWLSTHGIDIDDQRRAYVPVAKLVEGKLIGYNTQFANIGNKFLEMGDSTRECHFPNLFLVEIGNHPYPKEARYYHTWMVETYHRECHQILNPPSDPQNFFFQPSYFESTLLPS